MKEYKAYNRLYLQSELFLKTGMVSHGFTGSQGGVSTGKISGLNLGFRVEDNPENVKENYRLLAEDLCLDYSRIVLSKQTHTDNIRIVTEEDAGKGLTKESDIEDTDGLMTDIKGISLVVFTADCVPILFLDPKKQVVAAVHAGWRGTVKGIGAKAVTMMKSNFGSNPKDILAAIGPSIGPCCFEFGKEDAGIFPKENCWDVGNGKVLVDLWSVNKNQLILSGVPEKNIDISRVCTVCNSDRFYSYRTHRDKTGRQGAVIMINA